MAIPLSGRRSWPLVALLLVSGLLMCTGISPGAAGDPPEFTVRTNVTEVRLSFSATDLNNHGIATLQASDFAVVDKGFIVRDFQSFNRSDWTKLEIAVLVDTSESVTPRFRKEIASTLDLVSQTSGVPDENLSLFSFHDLEPAMLCAGDCRGSHSGERLPAARPGGLTPLFDTIVFASDFLAQRGDPHAARVLILFSDGEDTISRNSLGDAIDAALRGDIQIYVIDLNDSGTLSQGTASRGTAVLQSLANATGGQRFPARTGATTAMNAVLEGFRATYTVSYHLPSHASGFHSLRILPTHNLNLQFRSRSGYYYPDYVR